MIAYFDTSALIPLVIEEAGTAGAREVWSRADRVVSCRLVYAEARAALAQAQRLGRLDRTGHNRAVRELGRLYEQLDLIEIQEVIVRTAGDLAQRHALRGYDAVHLAAALRVADADTLMVSGDQELLDAAGQEALHVAGT